MMFAVIAAVLFLIALILQLVAVSLGSLSPSVLITAGLLCVALDLVGVGPRSRILTRR
jgi:hypothetical protein